MNTITKQIITAALLLLTYPLSAQVIAGGGRHIIVVCDDNTVQACGSNYYGQLGDGTTNTTGCFCKPNSVQVSGLTGIIAVAAGGVNVVADEGHHSLALRNDGTVWAWGRNFYGQLGDGTTTDRTTPVQVSGLTGGSMAIGAGYYHSIAVKNDGTVWTWGYNNAGQLGDNTTITRTTPVQVGGGLTGIIAVEGGEYNSLALRNDNTVWAWGNNGYGQCGDGTTINRYTPVQVSGLTGVVSVSVGYGHCLAAKNDGTAWSWGYNAFGQLGDGTSTSRNTPVQVSGLTGITKVAGGGTGALGSHSLALKNDGTVWSWGYGGLGQLGNGTTSDKLTPVQVSGITNVNHIAIGTYFSLAVKNDGTLWSWGDNASGQLGDGTTTSPRTTPVQATSGFCTVAPLPISLLSFTAQWLDESQTDALLEWSTASEQNNDYFEIQRKDGILEEWKDVVMVKGAGNSSSTLYYQYTDKTLPEKTKCDVFYYRLKQTDYNGQFTYSKTEVLTRGSITVIDPAPNPIRDELNFTLLSAADGEINITFTDMLGQLVKKEIRATKKGIQQIKIPLSLASGAYMLFVETSDGVERINKQFVIK